MFRKFSFNALLFITPLLLFWGYAEIGLHYIPTSYSKLKHYFYLNRKTIEVLVIGDSEFQLGVAPKYFQTVKGFNLSDVSQSVYTSSELVIRNIDTLPNLKLVIFEVGILSFFKKTVPSTEQWRDMFYYHFWGINPEFGKPDFTWKFRTGIYKFQTILSYALHGFYNIHTPYVNEIDSTGWEKGYFKNSQELLNDENGKRLVHTQLKNRKLTYNRKNIRNIIHLSKILTSKGVKLIFISTPVSKYFIKNIPEQYLKKTNRLFDSIYNSMDIPYYNFTTDQSFDDEDFRDVNHLNYLGAKKFSLMLSKIIEKNLQ